MKASVSVTWLCVAALMVAGCMVEDETASFDSPRLAELAKECKAPNASDRQKALEHFWKEVDGKAPLVEPASEPGYSWVTFLWRGDQQTHRVNMMGGPAPTDGDAIKWFGRLADTEVWYRTELVPNDARFLYLFQVNRPENLPADPVARDKALFGLGKKDAFNPHSDEPLASVVSMREAPREPWLERDNKVPQGTLTNEETIESEVLHQRRKFRVYSTPGDDGEKEGWLLVMFDGGFCADKYPTILDNLWAEKKIPQMTVLFVCQSEERDKELRCNESFAEFVAGELIPEVRKNYRISPEPGNVIVSGFSAGGLMSAYCALKHSDVFGNVLSMSGSYWWAPGAEEGAFLRGAEPGWLSRQYIGSARMPIRFSISAGRFENSYPVSLLAENRRFRDVLMAKGYDVQYHEYNSGHATICWYTPLVEGLIELTHLKESK